mgnify:CR=1 FL=1
MNKVSVLNQEVLKCQENFTYKTFKNLVCIRKNKDSEINYDKHKKTSRNVNYSPEPLQTIDIQ